MTKFQGIIVCFLLSASFFKNSQAEPLEYSYSFEVIPESYPLNTGDVVSGSFFYDPSAKPSGKNLPAWADEFGNYNQYKKAITDFVIRIGDKEYTSSKVFINIVDAPKGSGKKDGFFIDSGSHWGGGRAFKGFMIDDWVFSGFNFYSELNSEEFSSKSLPAKLRIGDMDSGMALHFYNKKSKKMKSVSIACCGDFYVEKDNLPPNNKKYFLEQYKKFKFVSSLSKNPSTNYLDKKKYNFMAAVFARKSYELGLALFDEQSANRINLTDNYANALFRAGLYEDAADISIVWKEMIEENEGEESEGLLFPYQLLITSLAKMNKPVSSKSYYKKSLNLIGNKYNKSSVEYGLSVLDITEPAIV